MPPPSDASDIPAASPTSPPISSSSSSATSSSSSSSANQLLAHPGLSLGLHLGAVGLIAITFFNRSLFGYHPTFMALSFLLFMPEAILFALRGTGKQRKDALYRHMYLNAAAGAASIVGMAAIVWTKELRGKPHLATPHSWIGISALLLSLGVSLGGLPLIFGFPKFLKKNGLPKTITKVHKTVGTLSFVLGVGACISGLQTFKPAHFLHKGALTYGMASLAFLSAVLILGTIMRKRAAVGASKAASKSA